MITRIRLWLRSHRRHQARDRQRLAALRAAVARSDLPALDYGQQARAAFRSHYGRWPEDVDDALTVTFAELFLPQVQDEAGWWRGFMPSDED